MINQKLYLGTWQFSGLSQFKKLSNEEIIILLEEGLKSGIDGFDTALVYGNGNVEKLIGAVLKTGKVATIITKIPAVIKPSLVTKETISHYYPESHIIHNLRQSCNNLQVNSIDIVLLHNWAQNWSAHEDAIKTLKSLKTLQSGNKIGISLPNGFEEILPVHILESIDVLELPYNSENTWSSQYISLAQEYDIEVILRSTLMTGSIVNTDIFDIEKHLEDITQLQTSITIGMTSVDQIHENCDIFNRIKKQRKILNYE